MIYGYVRVSTDKQSTENQRFEIENYSNRFVITSQIVLPFIYGIINLCMKRKYLLMCSVCAGGSDKRKKLCNSMFTELFPFLKKRCVRDSNP